MILIVRDLSNEKRNSREKLGEHFKIVGFGEIQCRMEIILA